MNDITGVIAFDPGKKTGWAKIMDGEFMSGQAPLWDVVHWFADSLDGFTGFRPTVFCEDFIITSQTAKKSRQTDPLDGIGAIKFLCLRYDLALTMQSPSKAQKFATDDKLKALGWYHPTTGGHANDAARHLMVGLVDQKVLNLSDLKTKLEEA